MNKISLVVLVVLLLVACGGSASPKVVVPQVETEEAIITVVGGYLAGGLAKVTVTYKGREIPAIIGMYKEIARGDRVTVQQFTIDSPGNPFPVSIWIASPQK